MQVTKASVLNQFIVFEGKNGKPCLGRFLETDGEQTKVEIPTKRGFSPIIINGPYIQVTAVICKTNNKIEKLAPHTAYCRLGADLNKFKILEYKTTSELVPEAEQILQT